MTSVAWKHGPTAAPPASTFAPAGDRVVDALLHGRERVLVDQRPDDRVHLLRIAGLQPGRLGGEARGELLGDRPLDDDPPRRHADLPLVQERAERRGRDGVVEVGVGEHDQRVRAAELEHDALQLAARGLGEPAARSRSSR